MNCFLQVTVEGSKEGESDEAAVPDSTAPESAADGAELAGSENALSMLSAYGSQQIGSPRSAAGEPPVATDGNAPNQAPPPGSPRLHPSDGAPAAASLAADLAITDMVCAAVTAADSATAAASATGASQKSQHGGERTAAETAQQEGMPPEDVQAIMAKLVAFVKVRPGRVYPAMRQNWTNLVELRSCG